MGKLAQVYLGRWRWYGLVAVKQLIEADERREQAFVREAELLQALRHPNIVSFLGACLEPGRVRSGINELGFRAAAGAAAPQHRVLSGRVPGAGAGALWGVRVRVYGCCRRCSTQHRVLPGRVPGVRAGALWGVRVGV